MGEPENANDSQVSILMMFSLWLIHRMWIILTPVSKRMLTHPSFARVYSFSPFFTTRRSIFHKVDVLILYLLLHHYSLSVASWGAHITPSLIRHEDDVSASSMFSSNYFVERVGPTTTAENAKGQRLLWDVIITDNWTRTHGGQYRLPIRHSPTHIIYLSCLQMNWPKLSNNSESRTPHAIFGKQLLFPPITTHNWKPLDFTISLSDHDLDFIMWLPGLICSCSKQMNISSSILAGYSFVESRIMTFGMR